MKLTRIFAVALAASTIVGSAYAADLPSRKEAAVYVAPAPIFTWTGFYVGLNVGYGFAGSSNINGTSWNTGNYPGSVAALDVAYSGSSGVKGILGGGQAGFNYQMGSLVAGIEADIQAAGLSSSISGGPFAGNPATAFVAHFGQFSSSQKVNWFGTVRGRLGFALDRFLVYATGGLAYGDVKNSLTYSTIFPVGAIATGNTFGSFGRLGWTVGAGAEYAISNNWTIKAEYLYTDLGNRVTNTATTFGVGVGIPPVPVFSVSQSSRTAFHTLRAGINYKFGWGAPAAVVAKY